MHFPAFAGNWTVRVYFLPVLHRIHRHRSADILTPIVAHYGTLLWKSGAFFRTVSR